jgi:hypothetical protein
MRNVLIILAIWAWVLIPPAIRQARGKGVDSSARRMELDFWAPGRGERDFWEELTEPTDRPPRIRNRAFRRVVAYLGLVDDPRYDGGPRAFGGFGGGGCGGGGTGGSGGGGC